VTTVLDAAGNPPPEAAILAAVEALKDGDIVGVPTDTVYGLAADPWHSGAADRLFRLKGRPRNVELPVFVADFQQALLLATSVPRSAAHLMKTFWPGALTVVLPRRSEVDADLGEEDATVGLRCPDHPVPLALCLAFGPYATTSANRHGDAPATTAQDLAEHLPGVELVLDGGECRGEPSTVIDCTGEAPRLLRAGKIAWEAILAAVPDC
jgi:tRNA threonylcarbamoyl adenosine modification protein (Sua5/YciO/YrdC/YwlC family)